MQIYDCISSYRNLLSYFLINVDSDGQCGRFEVVDTSGLLEFSAMIDLRISQAQALVVVYAINNERSFLLAKSLCERIRLIKGE